MQSPKGMALRKIVRKEFEKNKNISNPQDVEILKSKYIFYIF